jgi:hypothetical protein
VLVCRHKSIKVPIFKQAGVGNSGCKARSGQNTDEPERGSFEQQILILIKQFDIFYFPSAAIDLQQHCIQLGMESLFKKPH